MFRSLFFFSVLFGDKIIQSCVAMCNAAYATDLYVSDIALSDTLTSVRKLPLYQFYLFSCVLCILIYDSLPACCYNFNTVNHTHTYTHRRQAGEDES